MKKILSLVILGMLVCTSALNAGAQARKKRVAIMDFDYATVHSYVASIFGQDVDIGKGISDLLVTNLVKDGSYSVIERKALDKILAEQNFSNSDRANPTSAAKIGKMLGVDAIIVGSITQFGNDTKNQNIGGAGGNWGGYGLGGLGRKKSKAVVGLTARIVDIDTGGIISGDTTIEQMGEHILERVIQVASGELLTKAELLAQNDFIPWKRGVSL